jgi:hypothetical protein
MVCETLQRGRAADSTSTTRRQIGDRLVTRAMLKHGHKSAKYASALTAESRAYCIVDRYRPKFPILVTGPRARIC